MAQYSIFVLDTSSVSGLPDEADFGDPGGIGGAVGSPPFNITVNNTNWIEILVDDTQDANFNEPTNSNAANYGTQTLVNDVTLNGQLYPAGSFIFTAYDLTDTSTGLVITSFHISNDDDQLFVGPVQGIISSDPLTAGIYTFDQEGTSANVDHPYDDFICFCRGTHIRTEDGERTVETLKAGDQIETLDHGLQTIRWIGSSKTTANGKMRPIKINAGALNQFAAGDQMVPSRDLLVSPQHRMLLSGLTAELLFDESSVLVAAKHLINDQTIMATGMGKVEYFHILFDTHEVIFAEGAPSESFHPGEQGLGMLPEETRAEVLELFPELDSIANNAQDLAYPELKSFEVRAMSAV